MDVLKPVRLLLSFFVVVAVGLSGGFASCTCGPPVTPPDGGDGGIVIVSDSDALTPPEGWGKQKQSLAQPCGAYQWGDIECDAGLVCVKFDGGKQGLCLRSCPANGPTCTGNVPCREVTAGTWACLTNATLIGLGEKCTDTPCQPPLSCARAPHEAQGLFSCRAPCDPHPKAANDCPTDFFCGRLPQGGGACVPRPEGTVGEFGKCGPSDGICKSKPTAFRCAISPTRKPTSGSCLRVCDKDDKCPTGLVCIPSIKLCAVPCDPVKEDCKYGTCTHLESKPDTAVCY